MTLPQIKDQFYKELQQLYPRTEIESFLELILEREFGVRRIDLALDQELRERSWDPKPFDEALQELLKEKPIQYILGKVEFLGMDFCVDESVLIPRPETEELAGWVIESAKELRSPVILDVGTGSGCIAISLAKLLPGSVIHALDVSPAALNTARKNSKRHQTEIRFLERNILSPEKLEVTYDIMVSNPPYVRKREMAQMRKNVTRYEPDLALFVSDDDPLEFFRRIGEHGQTSLRPGGFLFFEINEYLGEKMVALLTSMGYGEVILKKDIYGKDRMIRAAKK